MKAATCHLIADKAGKHYLASHFNQDSDKVRFILPLEASQIKEDISIEYLAYYESQRGGYEYISRKFFDTHLEPGDVFIDVGAHWGMFSLTAATRWPGQIQVIAIEALPFNAHQLSRAVYANHLQEQIEIFACAAGEHVGLTCLHLDTSMGNTLYAKKTNKPTITVPQFSLDSIMASRPELNNKRIFLKIDAEGAEPDVIAGATNLLKTGRVAAIMWEKCPIFELSVHKEKMLHMLDTLKELGYETFRFPHSEYGGALTPFAPTPETGNMICLQKDFPRKTYYSQPFDYLAPYEIHKATPNTPEARQKTTALLADVKGTDTSRWANPKELLIGAEQRAEYAQQFLQSANSVLDLGAGNLSLQQYLPENCQYTAADIIPRSDDSLLIDLNQRQFPNGHFDVIVLLEVLEYLHDVAAVLKKCRTAGEQLVFSYHLQQDNETIIQRQEQGWFSHLSKTMLDELLCQIGWEIRCCDKVENHWFYCCC